MYMMVWTVIIMIKHSTDRRNHAPCDSILAVCTEGLRFITIAIHCGQHDATASIRQKWLHTCAQVNTTCEGEDWTRNSSCKCTSSHHVATIARQDCIGTYQSLSSERWSTKITVQC